MSKSDRFAIGFLLGVVIWLTFNYFGILEVCDDRCSSGDDKR